jgi:YegS/Rv2252/BmrU family lipid kinase|nr:diacylglycerol kinase family protein [Kofleriaceae bacterium]
MASLRTTVIINPKSQGGRLGKRWRELAEQIGRVFPFDEAMTAGPGDATRLVREALRGGAERIVAVGGDGTVNECVNGFFEDGGGAAIAPEATLGVIPFGTGGDFRRTLVLPTEAAAAARAIANGPRAKIDVGRVTFATAGGGTATRMFANISSFGSSGVIVRLVNASGKKFGALSFALATVRGTMSYDNQRVALTFDGGERVEATINTVAVANGKYFGGGMKVAPDAQIDDGAFDVVCLGDLTFGEILTSGRKIYSGAHVAMPKVSVRRARVVEAAPIEPGGVVELDVDGEAPGRLPAKFEVVPNALWFAGRGGPG